MMEFLFVLFNDKTWSYLEQSYFDILYAERLNDLT